MRSFFFLILVLLLALSQADAKPKKVYVTYASFIPGSNTQTWNMNSAQSLYGTGDYYAPLSLPSGAIVVSVTMYAFDNDPGKVCLSLVTMKLDPRDFELRGYNCTLDSSTQDPLEIKFTPTINAPITSDGPAFLVVGFTNDTYNLRFYGAKVIYTTP
jgi:hypothetical protein